jgi:hypothetical protein
MIEQAPRVEREFHVGPGGDRWTLTRSPKTGQPYVLHRPNETAHEVELDLGSFLVLFDGQEREELLRLIGSLLSDDGTDAAARTPASRAPRLISRWMPRARS